MTTKSDVYAFGVVLAELITGQRALIADKNDPKKMRSLATIVRYSLRSSIQETLAYIYRANFLTSDISIKCDHIQHD